ncbi:unknown protein [Parachlamydia acanthamoebae UV-7]|uniref:Uncharacterized protein n=2 Tax=Parachlamydia acanthamoebae TaxID=83552 RepID=F8KY95_PARAV|nr:hypothetical protein DB43_DZ00170 [Parachlamydia acanthamoebae]CCB85830.1 unknown protein [Parachlamydia acanthamoebae UV-7]
MVLRLIDLKVGVRKFVSCFKFLFLFTFSHSLVKLVFKKFKFTNGAGNK